MPAKEDFIQLLKKEGVPGDYYFDSSLLQTQMDYPGTVQVLDAFAQALPSLFVHSDSVKNADDLYAMVTTQPESFGLAANATGEDVKKAILTEMNKDKGMTFYPLPENTETGSPEGAPSVSTGVWRNRKRLLDLVSEVQLFPGTPVVIGKKRRNKACLLLWLHVISQRSLIITIPVKVMGL